MVNTDVPEGVIVGGVPAKVVGKYEDLKEKRFLYSANSSGKKNDLLNSFTNN